AGYIKSDEIPYDFLRKRLSIMFSKDNEKTMITKGALSNILEICNNVEMPDGSIKPLNENKSAIDKLFEKFSKDGNRTLGIAYKKINSDKIVKSDENEMTLLGFLVLYDPPKPNIIDTIESLKKL